MPSYAPYGNAIYGETVYGAPPPAHVHTTMSVSPVPTPINPTTPLYSSLFVSWILPGGNWNQLILVRSSFGVPISPFANDGVTLLDQTSAYSTSFTDVGLVSGRFYYYALYVYDTDIDTWIQAACAQGLCLTDYQFPHYFTSWTPDWYMEQDLLLTPAQPLYRFFQLIGFEMNWVRSEIESLFTLNSPEYVSGAMLPFLAGNVGIDYEPALGMAQSRVLVSNAAYLYKHKGTGEGVQAAASAYTGYACVLTHSPNLEIQLDDATFDRSVGHWVAQNAGTSVVEQVSTTTPGSVAYGVTTQHANYLPIQGNVGLATSLLTQANANGYLPSNNEDLLLLSAVSTNFNWTHQPQSSSIPPTLTCSATAYNPSNGTTVMFGGSTNGGSSPMTNQTWIFNGTYWTEVFPATSPPARGFHAMAYDAASGNILLFGGSTQTNPPVANDTWSWNGITWTQLAPATSPPARFGHAMAQNPGTNHVVMFGGYTDSPAPALFNDTWVWTGTTWLKESPVTSPSARAGHAMAYDSFEQATPNLTTGVVVLFGGSSSGIFATPGLNDTWYWNGTTWANPSPVHSPPARSSHVMAYDVVTDNVVLFGGYDNYGDSLDDAWYWGGTNWNQITNSTNNPPGRFAPTMAYDTLGTVVLNGGRNSNGYLNDTWLLNASNSQWVQIEGGQTPQARRFPSMCYDTATSNVLMWGGINVTTGLSYNSLWQWNATSGWIQLQPTSALPPAGYGASLIYTTGGNCYLLFGYIGNALSNAGIWHWNGTSWNFVATSGTVPTGREFASAVYDPTVSKIIFFGGFDGLNVDNDTWTYTTGTNTWAQLSPTTPPTVRYGSGFVYTTGGISTLFGGFDGNNYLNDTWQFNSATSQWAHLAPPTVPSAREYMSMVYDTSANEVVMFGGQGSSGGLTDNWTYTAGSWTLTSNGTTIPNYLAVAAYVSGSEILAFDQTGATYTSAAAGGRIHISECNSANATTLGIPIQPGNTTIALSGYFQPAPAAAPTLQSFFAQIDWYGQTGNLISSTIGTPVAEIAAVGPSPQEPYMWVRPYVVGTAPAGAVRFGRTFKTVSTSMTGDLHLMDAVQTEISMQATPGPTSWTPPRDLWLNLFPVQRNLVVNGQGFAGGFGWTATLGSITPVNVGPSSTPTWPQNTSAGFQLSYVHGAQYEVSIATAPMPVIPGQFYTASTLFQTLANYGQFPVVTISWYATQNISSLISTSSPVMSPSSTIGGAWYQQTIPNVMAPVGANWATLTVQDTVSASPPTLYMAAPLFNTAFATQYFDGTFSPSPDFSFDGTPNESPTSYYPNVESRLSRLLTVMPDFIPIGATFSIYTGQAAYDNIQNISSDNPSYDDSYNYDGPYPYDEPYSYDGPN